MIIDILSLYLSPQKDCKNTSFDDCSNVMIVLSLNITRFANKIIYLKRNTKIDYLNCLNEELFV